MASHRRVDLPLLVKLSHHTRGPMLLLSLLAPMQPWREALQAVLERAEPDVLILLDCCAAASSAADAGSGVTELIAVRAAIRSC